MPQKGSQFERQICVSLSKWWTRDPSNDGVFWRSTTSGARATTRAKKGKKTAGQYGDITAIDPAGKDLMALVTMELKRGYPRSSIHDCLDRGTAGAINAFEKWIKQAQKASDSAGTPYWWLITRKDRREAILWMPLKMYQQLHRWSAPPLSEVYHVQLQIRSIQPAIVGIPFELFVKKVPSRVVQALAIEIT